jgi:hypothetical protein
MSAGSCSAPHAGQTSQQSRHGRPDTSALNSVQVISHGAPQFGHGTGGNASIWDKGKVTCTAASLTWPRVARLIAD